MKQYCIANLELSVEGTQYSYFQKRMNRYISDTTDSDINIMYCASDNIVLPKGKTIDKVHKWNWMEACDKSYRAYQKHPLTHKVLSLIKADKDWKNICLNLSEFENDYGITNEQRCFVNTGEVFAYSILKYNGIVLHSSAIDYDGNGVLFSAPSGIGKSTHASLWVKHYGDKTCVINDDTPAIRVVDNVAYAFGTPWSGKTDINNNRSVPLRAIVFLERSADNKIREIKGAEAVSLMLNETRKSVYPEIMDLCLETINRIIAVTPIYVLSCNISKEAVDLVKNTLGLP